MKICHVCLAECEDNAEFCPVCGALLDRNEEKSKEKEIIINNPTLLASFDDVVDAEIFKDILTDNGIVFSSDSGEGGSLKVMFGVGLVAEDIYVDECDFEAADRLYTDFVENPPFSEIIEDDGDSE